jgi:hypothetical protein
MRVQLRMDTSEADAIIAILDARAANRQPSQSDWEQLFSSKPYQALKHREESFHNAFNDDDFKQFVLSATLAAQRESLERTLREWNHSDIDDEARRLLAYLPSSSVIQADVFPVIKPQKNSFVFHVGSVSAIFLNLDPGESAEHFLNTVTHELHHIGLDSFSKQYEERISALPEGPQKAAEWLGSFGEGFAMLAAAGGPDVHPLATDKPEDRERWDHDMANFNSDLRAVDQFLLDVAEGKLNGDAAIERGESFYGARGPWYTVGYKVAVIVENNFGREELIRCMEDPRRLLAMYNKAAARSNSQSAAHLELWSSELLDAVRVPGARVP